jgi:uncharacterized protein YoaH (UPF0181 family)
MSNYFKAIDRFAATLARRVIAGRWLVLLLSLVLALGAGFGAGKLEFSTNYRVFFSDANPELQAFENLQDTYTKNDNFLFVFEPADEAAFSKQTLAAVERLTEAAWKIPFAIRVDSISNFQHTYSIEDDLIVEDLVKNATARDPAFFAEREAVALAEPLLRDQLLTRDAGVTAINVVLQYPEKDLMEVPQAVEHARGLAAMIEAEYPAIEVHLSGVSMLNNAFAETGMSDGATLMPLMFVVIFVLTWLIIRSLSATFTTLVIIGLSSMIGMGVAGYFGVKLTPISMSAPIVILTLAVADSIHILLSLRSLMREGMARGDAIVEAVRINFLPVSITSVTTIVGFLALNVLAHAAAGAAVDPALPRQAVQGRRVVAACDGQVRGLRHRQQQKAADRRRRRHLGADFVRADARVQRPVGRVFRRAHRVPQGFGQDDGAFRALPDRVLGAVDRRRRRQRARVPGEHRKLRRVPARAADRDPCLRAVRYHEAPEPQHARRRHGLAPHSRRP